jgi:hypothetical protein
MFGAYIEHVLSHDSMTTHSATHRRKSTNRQETGQYLPRQFNPVTRERFLRDRGRLYLSCISGAPSDAQRALIHSMTSLEWAALASEKEGALVGFRPSGPFARVEAQACQHNARSAIFDCRDTAGMAIRR